MLLSVSAVALGATPSVASSAFQPAVTISGPAETAGSADVALDKGGDAVAVWERLDPSSLRFRIVSAFGSAGGDFGSAHAISDPGEDARSPRVAVGQNGEAVAVWVGSDGSHRRVQAAFRPKGGSFGPSQTISDPGQQASEPAEVAVDRHGGAVAVWQSSDGRIQAAFRPKGGGFGGAQTLSDPGGGAFGARIAMDKDGDAVAVWQRFDGSNGRIQAAFRPRGGTFGPAETISAAGRTAIEPDVAMDDAGNAIAVWERHSDEGGLRAQATFRPRGGNFGPAQTLSEPGNNVFIQDPVRVAMNKHGDAIAVFMSVATPNNNVQAAFRPAGGSFGPAQTLSNPGQNSFAPEVAIDDDGDAVAMWESVGGGVIRQIQAAFATAGGSFGTTQGVSDASQQALNIEVAADRDGNAIAVWHELLNEPGPRARVRAAFSPAD
jgi:hypothetical protein